MSDEIPIKEVRCPDSEFIKCNKLFSHFRKQLGEMANKRANHTMPRLGGTSLAKRVGLHNGNVTGAYRFANADEIPKEVKDKVVEKLGDSSGKPEWTVEHNEGDAQNQQKITNNTVPKNVVIL